MPSIQDAATSVRAALKSATRGLVERETLVDLVVLCAVASEHLLVIGPPGTGKSAAVRQVAQVLGGRYFEYLLGRYTEPSEIFGPVDIRKLKEGVIETATAGMLPEAEIAFLDEVFLGSTAILNTLLGVLNERTFRRGHTQLNCPLRICVAAANGLPDEEGLGAFADRFLAHAFIEPVPDSELEALLQGGWHLQSEAFEHCSSLAQLDVLSDAVKDLKLEAIQSQLAHCIRLLRKENVLLSDRRIVKSQRLIAAATVLAGREEPSTADLWPLIYVIPTHEGQQMAREVLSEALQTSENEALSSAAEDASQGPLARAQRLQERGEALLTASDNPDQGLLLESLGREIDASFPLDILPTGLKTVRERILQQLGLVE